MKRTNIGLTSAGLSSNISLSFSHCSSHSLQPPGKGDQTKLARGNGCRGSTKKATAIEIGHFGHLHTRFADSSTKMLAATNTLAAKKLKIGDELGFLLRIGGVGSSCVQHFVEVDHVFPT